MDGAWDKFWIKSQNGTFIALQIKAFCPKQCSNFMQIPHRNQKNIFVWGSYESLERLKGKIGEAPFFFKFNAGVKKCHFGNFLDWAGILFVLGSYESLERFKFKCKIGEDASI